MKTKREQRHLRLVEAALRVFARSGFDGASVSEIANEAGIAKGSVYLYFDSKEALAGEVVRSIFADPHDLERYTGHDDPLEAVVEFCVDQQERVRNLGQHGSIVLHMWGAMGRSGDDLIGRMTRQVMAETRYFLSTLLNRVPGLDSGESLESRKVHADALLAIVLGLISQMLSHREAGSGLEQRVSAVVRAYLRGIMS